MKIKGIILKQALQENNLTQEQAAKKLNISRPTLSVWCNKEFLTKDIIQNVNTFLNIDLTNVRYSKNINSETNYSDKDKIIELLEKTLLEKDRRIADKDEIINLLREQLDLSKKLHQNK